MEHDLITFLTIYHLTYEDFSLKKTFTNRCLSVTNSNK